MSPLEIHWGEFIYQQILYPGRKKSAELSRGRPAGSEPS
jgi:hypothetical protein